LKLAGCEQLSRLPRKIRVGSYCIVQGCPGLAHLTEEDVRAATGAKHVIVREHEPC
jgi:hypothetical protein